MDERDGTENPEPAEGTSISLPFDQNERSRGSAFDLQRAPEFSKLLKRIERKGWEMRPGPTLRVNHRPCPSSPMTG